MTQLEFHPQTDYLIVTIRGPALEPPRPSLADQIGEKLTNMAKKFVIFQCAECNDIGPAFMRELAMTYKLLASINGKMVLVAPNKKIQEAIKKQALDRLLVAKLSLRGALVEFGLVKEKDFDVNFINPFLAATQRVLKVQCFLDSKPAKPYLKKPTDPMLIGDLSGIIGITSEAFSGTLAISFKEEIFCKIASSILGTPYPNIIPEIVDLAGELSNMILGQAKIELNTLGYQIQQALPSCVWGKDHQIKTFGGGACIVLPLVTAMGEIHVEVSTNQTLLKSIPPKAA
ncbi:chemotaxis protein CheX [Bdellovibrionota bacterium FG-1]